MIAFTFSLIGIQLSHKLDRLNPRKLLTPFKHLIKQIPLDISNYNYKFNLSNSNTSDS